jgi:hypothetical protein
MWILPKQLHTSAFVPDTEALISDLNEQSQACAQSLLVRSKVSPARTWSLKWKRDSWTQLLSGRILKPSHGPSFTAAWTSSVADIRASHSAPPASDSAPKTHGTSGRTYQPELLQCDQVPVSLRMSRDISALGFPTCCKTWQEWVTERRGAYSARVKLARLTRGKESSSWPTIRASEYKDVGPVGSKSHDHMLGKHYLCAVVTQDAATNGQAAPASSSSLGNRQGLSESSQRNWQTFAPGTNNRGMTPHRQVVKALVSGEKAQTQMLTVDQVFAEEIKGTNRQELWLTPRANEPDSDPNFAARNADRGAHCHGTLSSQAKEMWPTITAHTPDMESNGPNGHQGTYVAGAVKQWATPRSGKTTDENPETWALRQAKGDVATMPLGAQVKMWPTASVPNGGQTTSGRADKDTKKQVRLEHAVAQWGTPAANDANKTPHCEVNSNQAGLAKSVGLELQRQWATPRNCGGPDYAKTTRPTSMSNSPSLPTQVAMQGWITPKASDGKSPGISRDLHLNHQAGGKLNPRWVETLMGLPIGWTMPSCTSPQTIAPTSCDSSAMELSLLPQSELSEFSLAS